MVCTRRNASRTAKTMMVKTCLLALVCMAMGTAGASVQFGEANARTRGGAAGVAEAMAAEAVQEQVTGEHVVRRLRSTESFECDHFERDRVNVTFTWEGRAFAFELERMRGIYAEGSTMTDHEGELIFDNTDDQDRHDAKFTFTTTSAGPHDADDDEALGVVTMLTDGSVHAFFDTPETGIIQFATARQFEHMLGHEHSRRILLEEDDLVWEAHGDRYLGAEVEPKFGGICDGDDNMDNVMVERVRAEGGAATRRELNNGNVCRLPAQPKTISMGLVLDQALFNKYQGTNAEKKEAVRRFVEETVASVNVIFLRYINVVLRIGTTILHSDADTEGDFSSCQLEANQMHSKLELFLRRKSLATAMGHWHLITGCKFLRNVVGVAYVGTMCSKHTWGKNSAVSAFGSFGSTFLTLAHETAHVFGALHSFENEQGKTGGIMDYGDGFLIEGGKKTRYGFNPKRIEEMCLIIDEMQDDNCPHLDVRTPSTPVCGDKLVTGDEDCECPNGQSTCTGCKDCKFRKPKSETDSWECNANIIMRIPFGSHDGDRVHSDCCKGNLLESTSTSCDNGNGYCARGKCVNKCATYFNSLELCGTAPGLHGSCRQKCIKPSNKQCTSGLYYSLYGTRKYIGDVPNGSKCIRTDGSTGVCASGFCEVGWTGVQPAPETQPPVTQPPEPEPEPEPTSCGDITDRTDCCFAIFDNHVCHASKAGTTFANGNVCESHQYILDNEPAEKVVSICPKQPTKCRHITDRDECCKFSFANGPCVASKNGAKWSGQTVCRDAEWVSKGAVRRSKVDKNRCT